jgi:hypothetical protein
MKARVLVAVAAVLLFAVAASFSYVWGAPQEESPKKSRQPQTTPVPPETKTQPQSGEPGTMGDTIMVDRASVLIQVDSMIQRMTMVIERTRSYSKSFGLLAEDHHGADKKEILMMQRMSDSMGSMAGEIKLSLQQYKEMLADETASESTGVKVEVENFRIILDGIARDVEKAVNALQKLEEQLGQG